MCLSAFMNKLMTCRSVHIQNENGNNFRLSDSFVNLFHFNLERCNFEGAFKVPKQFKIEI